ncbi:MAG: DUF192 domain-containing protein [Myxococcaceae bacterium]|nr:DUF192 domain-containing protein [Myxococcaceae bacterium]
MKVLAALLLVVACQSEGGKPASPSPSAQAPAPAARPVQTDVAAEDYVMPPLPKGRITLSDAFGGKHVIDIEIAATQSARTRGLMWRRELADGKGMLFIFRDEQRLSFWMKNTLIPLDMIFLDKDLKIAGVVENAEPRTFTSRGIGVPTLFVLEVPGGWWAKNGMKAGSVAVLEGAGDIKAEP